jgi:hypothetical protein
MMTGRRTFLESLALGAVGATALDFADPAGLSAQAAGHWDLTWTTRLKAKRRAVMDVPEIEDGYGVWRAIIWRRQYAQVFGLAESAINSVLIIRHNAIVLALNSAFWDRYGLGAENGVKDPATGEPARGNPVAERTGERALPQQFAGLTIEDFVASGGIVLGCALAFRDCVDRVSRTDTISMEEADRRARSMLLPGVVMQPSGVFAAVVAQDYGCHYVRAS